MAFAQDRDLLAVEPGLLAEVGWLGQRVVKGTASVSGTTLTLSSGGPDFAAAGVDAGGVLTIDGAPAEVIARTSASTLTVSRVRALSAGDPIGLVTITNKALEVVQFGPQREVVHRQVLRMLGLDADGVEEGGVGAEAVRNPGALVMLETLGALHLIYAAAGAVGPAGEGATKKAELYRARFAQERGRAAALVDLDGDGVADATRRCSAVVLLRG